MARISPLSTSDLAEFQDRFDVIRNASGYVPNSLLTLARRPRILEAVMQLASAVMREPGEVPRGLKWMIAHVTSNAAGCRYCQAHTAHNASHADVPAEKIDRLWAYAEDPLFTDAERAALELAQAAGAAPSAATDAHFSSLKKHFSEDQIVEIVAVISMFGWFNRWNDTMATDLEQSPLAFGNAHLGPRGWTAGKHQG